MFEQRYCKQCGQRIRNNLITKEGMELEDGWYCTQCARIIIQKRRMK
jgi:hypothetical protein